MPNTLALLVLIVWPLISIVLYLKYKPLLATLVTIIGGFLILPLRTEFDFPLIPVLDKYSITSITALLACLFISKKKISLIPPTGVERWLVIAMFITPLVTVLTNQEPFGTNPGLTYHDLISSMLEVYIQIIPLILGYSLVKTIGDQKTIFNFLVITGLIYSLPALLEVRLSPQLNVWIYGFFPSSFMQQIRGDSYRPVVFVGHGLLLAFYFFVCFASAIILWKQKIHLTIFNLLVSRKKMIYVVLYLLLILALCRSASPLLYGLSFFLIITLLSSRLIKLSSLFIISIVILYPMLCIMDIFPHKQIIEFFTQYSPERAASLDFRFFHEGRLLEHAQDKLMFGWGVWGRNRLPGSVTDGYWIIVFGVFGLVGFVSFFSLAFLSVIRGIKASNFVDNNGKYLLLGHALLISLAMLDQIINASMGPLIWFLIGALLGRTKEIIRLKNTNDILRVDNTQHSNK